MDQKTGFKSPVDKSRNYTTGKEKQKMYNAGTNGGGIIENFNSKYNRSSQIFKTGETPGGGVYVCKNCGNNVAITKECFLPPCPRCNGLEFVRKS
jgi:DNA-directed RNA polymerase subunit RPC12/RpoP